MYKKCFLMVGIMLRYHMVYSVLGKGKQSEFEEGLQEIIMAEWVSHLIVAAWKRAKAIPEIAKKTQDVEENWDEFKKLYTDRKDRMKDFFVIEREYLDKHPESGYFTEIQGLEEFPDYIDYLPHNSIPTKIKMMYYMPAPEEGQYPFMSFSKEEYCTFLDRSVRKVVEAIVSKLKPTFTSVWEMNEDGLNIKRKGE